jgi:hypothetical protein
MDVSRLVTVEAATGYQRLLDALGTENQSDQWMVFMEAVTELLPDVLAPGRPSAAAIHRCMIGQLGFASWTAMIEAPLEARGLGWSWSAWKQWRRAWASVERAPWLRQSGMTPAQVNALALDAKAMNVELPASQADADALRDQKARQAQEKAAASLQGLQQRAEAAEAALLQEQRRVASVIGQAAEAATLREQLQQVSAQVAAQAEQLGALRAQLEQARSTVEQLEASRDAWRVKAEQAAKARPAPAPKLSRWGHLVAALTGD